MELVSRETLGPWIERPEINMRKEKGRSKKVECVFNNTKEIKKGHGNRDSRLVNNISMNKNKSRSETITMI